MMKLYWGPHTCAIGIHILLEEIGAPYETAKIDVAGGDVQKEPFQSINPKGKVPTLVRDDGSVLTEFGAIATWLARTHPQAGLLPEDPEQEARAIEAMEYIEGTVHGQGFGRIFLPARFEPQDAAHQSLGLGTSSVQKQGRAMVERGFHIIEGQWGSQPYVAGERFSVADAALFYAERWAPQNDIALPPKMAAHYERVRARPAVQKVLHIWGEA